jgi:hypothetical protein
VFFFLHVGRGFVNFFPLKWGLETFETSWRAFLNFFGTSELHKHTLLLFDFDCFLGLISLQAFARIE